jgi:Putative zinc-finger
MECVIPHSDLSDYLDGWATDQERRDIERHLSSCTDCSGRVQEYREIRQSMRQLPSRKLSQHVITKLQVLASRESARRRKRIDWAHAASEWYSGLRLCMHNMMRPLALPIAGGLFSTAALFALLMPDLAHEVHPVHNDIETSVFTQATVKEISPIGGVSDNDITVDLIVDQNGRMLEYRVIGGNNLLRDESMRHRLENNLMYGQFNPATQFGQPVAGKLRVTFRSSTIDIKG